MSSRNLTGALKALIDEQSLEMYGLVEGSARPLAGALNEPRKLVAAALISFLAKRDMGARLTQADYQAALRELRKTPDLKLAQMGGAARGPVPGWVGPLRLRMVEVLRRKAEDAGEMAARHAQEQARAMGIKAESISTEDVQRRGLRVIGKRLSAISADQAEAPYKDIKRRLAIGLAAGVTLAELVRSLMRVGGRRGPIPDVLDPNAVGNAIADSLFGVASRAARRVAVTEIANAYNVQMLLAMEDMGTTLKRWDSSNDRKVCANCRDMHGRITELSRAFPNGSMGPPLHPNCRCVVTVWRERARQGEY